MLQVRAALCRDYVFAGALLRNLYLLLNTYNVDLILLLDHRLKKTIEVVLYALENAKEKEEANNCGYSVV